MAFQTLSQTHAPFPDVTGLRTSGPEWSRISDDCEYIHVEHQTQLEPASLRSQRSGDILIAAWASILYHYGSHEASNVEIVELAADVKCSIMTFDFEQAKSDHSFDVAKIIEHVSARREEAFEASQLDHGYAAIVMADQVEAEEPPKAFQQLSMRTSKELSLLMTAFARSDKDVKRLMLAMKASPAVHTEQSATLQLRQIDALLSSFLKDSKTHALSLERFERKLRASDNPGYVHLPPPDYLQHRHHDRLEGEFEYFADTRPNDLALDFRFDLQDRQSVKWTYAEMNARADAVRDLLWSHGVGSVSEDKGDHIVALYLEKSPETYLSFLSVIKAGAAWCPIDTDWPASRRQALLVKSKAKVVLTAGDSVSDNLMEDLQSEDMKDSPMHPIRLDQVQVQKDQNRLQPKQLTEKTDAQLAYMIWTSGTTGLPKGVGIQHSAIIQAMRALRLKIPYGKEAIGTDEVRYLQYSAYNFDLSIMDCFYAWGIGGTICACPRGLLLQDLVAVGTSFKPTHTLLTPAVMAMTERHKIPSLKVVINGGEKLSQVVADEWSKECCLLNLYGPAEATLIAMNRRVPLGDRVKAPNIGVALPTVSCHALDKSDKVVLKGAVGELVLGGPQLARGYVGDPVKTADKFFQHAQLGRVYRTGDQVRQLGSEEFEYLGRIDDQVKINGIRIELLEINAVIKNSHKDVKDSETMAFSRPGSDTELQIINFSVLPSNGGSDELLRTDDEAVVVARELQQAAKESLPSYMLPSMFIILSGFPRTSSAKIDRVALKQVLANFDSLDWENKLAGDGVDDSAPPSEAEECMRKWLAKLCNVAPEKISRNTPFTSVGLDSIRAITFSQKMLQEGYMVSVLDVAEFPTLISLSRQLESSASQSEQKLEQARQFFDRFDKHFRQAVLDHLSAASGDIAAVLPCTPLQEGMLAESQKDALAYRIQRQYRLSQDFDRARLASALDQLIQEVESLRTTFLEVGRLEAYTKECDWPSQPYFLQAVWSKSSAKIHELELSEKDGLESQVLQAVADKVKLDPFSSEAPVAFMLVKQGQTTSLILVAHHSIYDARSLSILEDKIEKLYSRLTDDFKFYQFSTALAHIIPLTAEDEKHRSDVWQKALEAFPKGEISLFPNLSGKSVNATQDKAQIHRAAYRKSFATWQQLEKASRKLGISARPLAQVAWAKVLASYLDTDHLIIGDSVSGRSAAAELEQVVGPVLSTLPVVIYFSPGQTFAQTAKQVDDFHRSVFSAQHTHLSSLRKVLGLSAGQSMFHSVFVFEPAAEHSSEKGLLGLERVADLGVATEHALGVEVQPDTEGNIRLGVSWQRSQVSDEFGRLLLDQFDACLTAACSSYDETLGSFANGAKLDSGLLSISTSNDVPSIQEAVSVNVATFVAQESIGRDLNAVEIFQEIPGSASGRQPSHSITYGQLDEASSRAAALFSNVPRNSTIAVCLERSLDSYIYPLAILKAGHAYLPIDETLPLDRKQLLLSDSSAACLVTSSQIGKDLANSVKNILVFDSDAHKNKLASTAVPSQLPRASPEDLAFIIYTSGSTGKPKGCLLTQKNLSVAIEAFRLTYEREAPGSFDGATRFLARSAEAFDVHLLEIFLTLRVGGTIVTGPRHIVHEDIGRTMSVFEVTHACVVPSLFFSNGERVRPEQVPSLRALIIGGEALTSDLIELWGSSADERPVVLNAYGPSEATIGNSMARVSKRSVSGNIGKPFNGTRYVVLKEVDGKLVPTLRGEPGELCIGGEQLAKGYLNRPDLKSFFEWEGQWFYRTGDMVRLNPFDEAEYLGRIDGTQVKVRGARLELGEVDSALQSALTTISGKRGVVITILTDHQGIDGPARLVSFVSSQSQRQRVSKTAWLRDQNSADLASALRKGVRSRLPQYMVPSLVLALEFIPLSPLSGKVDTKSLRELYKSLDAKDLRTASTDEVREMADDEKEVAEILKSMLRIEDSESVQADTDLIALGLDSLSLVTLAGRLRRAGFKATAVSIMNEPTVAAIAASSKKQGANGHHIGSDFQSKVQELTQKARTLLSLSGKKVEKVLPCVPLQVALIAQALSVSGDSPRYVTTVTINVNVDYSADQLQEAWKDTLARHEIYRTIFVEVEEELCQVVLSPESSTFTWEVAADGKFDLNEHHKSAARSIASTFEEQPPFRLKLWKEGAKQTLALTCSHALYDGTSLSILLLEVSNRLEGKSMTKVKQFSEVVSEIVGQSEGAAKDFWSCNLEGFGRSPAPVLTGLKATSESFKSDETTMHSSHCFSALESAARAKGITVHSLLVSAFCQLFAEYLGEDDVTIGLVLGGRTLVVDGIESIHGPCVTTVPFRVQEARKSSPKTTHRAINDLLPYQHVSLPQLMRWLNLDKVPFEALFSYLGVQQAKGSSALTEEGTIMEKDYPLAVEASVVGDDVQLHIDFATQLFPKEHAGLFLSQLDSILGSIAGEKVEMPEQQLSVVNKDCYVPTSPSESFLSRFVDNATKQPEAPAIVYAETMDHSLITMTYAELDSLSSNMARHLVSYPDQVIGVHLTKDGPRLYVAMLAVWKAGKTYLPLDPSLPSERLEYMLETVGQAPAITSKETASTLTGSSSTSVDIDELMKPSDSSIPLPSPRLDTPCYLLFTSGSTGRPKAVQISQQALSGAIYSWERILPWSASSRFLQLASIGFDVSLIEVCMPLSLGFSFGTAPKNVLIEDLTTAINKLGITIADLPAALAGTVHPNDVDLEWLMSGGDAIDERVISDWTTDSHVLINAWGPTETTIGSSLGRVKRGSSRSVVGEVYPACSMFVLKEDSTEVALLGAIGELAVGGPQVADKYYGREDLTAERFVYLKDGTRIYRTGDLGRFLVDGTIECLGRIGADRQVKVNGQRVELDEIAQALASQGGVKDADVQYLKHPGMATKQLVAFIVPSEVQGSTLSMREDSDAVSLSSNLEQEAIKRLAPYMIPAHWLVLTANLPLTPNNKVDHKALATLFDSTDPNTLGKFGLLREGVLSQGSWMEEEKKLRELVASFCGIPQENIMRTTSFHRLGIDSITAIKLVKTLRGEGYGLTVADVMSSPYISSLAEKQGRLTESSSSKAEQLAKQIQAKADIKTWLLSEKDEIISALPCTPLQAGMITQTLVSGGKLYFHHHAFQVPAFTSTIRTAWEKLVQRLDVLRTTFHPIEDERPWVQAVHAETPIKIIEHTGDFSDSVDGQLTFESEQAFTQPPHVLHLWAKEEETILMLSLHHALYDASSLPELFADLTLLLQGSEPVKRSPFHQLVPFLLPSSSDTQYWTQQLQGFTPTLLRSTTKDSISVESHYTIPLPLSQIQSICLQLGISLQVLSTLAYAKLLALETKTGDVCFGQIFGLHDVSTAVGPALNTIATHVGFSEPLKASEHLKAMQKSNDEGRPHRTAALRDVQQQIGMGVLFDALFDFQVVGEAEEMSWKRLELKGDEGAPQYALNVEFVQEKDRVSLYSTADSGVYSSEELKALLRKLGRIFIHLVQENEANISSLPKGEGTILQATAIQETKKVGNGHSTEQPSTEEGRTLAAIIASVSGVPVERIYASTRLTLLGLDSISAIRIASMARRKGLSVGVADIVSAETVEGIATVIRSKAPSKNKIIDPLLSHEAVAAAKTQLDLSEKEVERILPILPGQAFALANWLNSGKRTGMFSFVYRTESSLSPSRLEAAWRALQERHAILRTAFFELGKVAYQVVLTLHDLPLKTGEKAQEVIRSTNAEGWNLRRPPVQLTLVGEKTIVMSLHHALYDAISISLMVEDLEALYLGKECTSSNNWTQFVDHVAPSLQTSPTLPGASSGLIPYSEEGETFSFHPDILKDYNSYESRLRTRGTSLQALFLAAWSILLSRKTGASRPAFGVYHLGRSSDFDGVETLAGPCMSVHPISLPPGELLDVSKAATQELRKMAKKEQTFLPPSPPFNTLVNILLPPSPDGSQLFTPLQLGHPTDFTPPPTTTPSSIDSISYHTQIHSDLNIDIALSSHSVSIGIKAKSGMINTQEVAKELVELVENFLKDL